MIKKEIFTFLFSGSTLRRWNGFACPINLWEIDRQGHAMMVAWLLCALDSQTDAVNEEKVALWNYMIEEAFVRYWFNLVITDIKPHVYAQIKKNKEEHRDLVYWALDARKNAKSLEKSILYHVDTNLYERAREILLDHPQNATEEKAHLILRAASAYTRLWELSILKNNNQYNSTTLLADIEKSIQQEIIVLAKKLPSLQCILPAFRYPTTIIEKIPFFFGELRFQQRWSQTSRLPETNVAGHSFLVACFAYIMAKSFAFSPIRTCNAFFCGLFHDMPEVFTQDVVNPVKNATDKIAQLLHKYEQEQLNEKLLHPLGKEYPHISNTLQYLLGTHVDSEFYNTIQHTDTTIQTVTFADLEEKYGTMQYNPKDGIIIKFCDTFSAFLEAEVSIQNGIHPQHLCDSRNAMFFDLTQFDPTSYIYSKNYIKKIYSPTTKQCTVENTTTESDTLLPTSLQPYIAMVKEFGERYL